MTEHPKRRIVAENRKARYSYFVTETIESGIMLLGTEVKSLRSGRATIAESYASIEEDELWLINGSIPAYSHANQFNHDERRKRKLLVRGKQFVKLKKGIQREGMTIVPLQMYFNEKGKVKIEIGLAKGKKLHDKRQTEKAKDWNRDKQRLLKNRNSES